MNIPSTLICVALLTSVATAQTPCAWQVESNLGVIEVEASAPTGAWVAETLYPGFAGSSYYRWSGPDNFNTPGMGVMSYTVEVHDTDLYKFVMHNRHQDPDDTEENDCWVRMDGGSWIKCFSNGPGTVANWNWNTVFEINGVQLQAVFSLTKGRHTFEISGRSNGFMIDRINFARGNPAGIADVNTPVSDCAIAGRYCSSTPNSSGSAAKMQVLGSIDLPDNGMTLQAGPVPNNTLGLFFFGSGTANLPFGNGRRCISGSINRLPVMQATGGNFAHLVDFTTGNGTVITNGSTWHFQAWFRDVSAGGANFDLSDAMHVNFLP
jgi:hypothetical protein